MAKITENTVKDLQYLGQYVFSGATGLTAGKQAKILREYNATLPRSAIDLDAICPDDLAGSIAGVQNIFWPTLIGTGIEIPPCQDQHVLAVADFRAIANHPDRKNLFLRTGNPLSPIRTDTYGPSGSGIEISAAGQYLEFNTGALGFSFSGVIVKLELNSIIPDEPDVKYYLIDL